MKKVFIIFDIEMNWSQIERITKIIKTSLTPHEEKTPPKDALDEYKEKLKKVLKVDVQIEDSELDPTTIKIPGPGILIPWVGNKLKNIVKNKENKKNNDQTDPIIKELLKQPEITEIETISLAEIIEEYKKNNK